MIFLCGIPEFCYNEIRNSIIKSLSNELVAGLPARGTPLLTQNYFNECIDTLIAFHGGRPSCFEKGLCFLVLSQVGENFRMARNLYPFALIKEVPFGRRFSLTGSKSLRDKNEIGRILVSEAKKLSKLTRTVTSYLESKVNRTPFLLPDQHFGEDSLARAISSAWENLPSASKPDDLLNKIALEFEKDFPFSKKEGARGRFINSKEVWFTPPGRDRHGDASPHRDHPSHCFLSGVVRLGGSILAGFHYDCTAKGATYSGTYSSCHGQMVEKTGKPHLNVYPNNYIR